MWSAAIGIFAILSTVFLTLVALVLLFSSWLTAALVLWIFVIPAVWLGRGAARGVRSSLDP